MSLGLMKCGRGPVRLVQMLLMVFLMLTISTHGAGCNLKEKISLSLTDEIPEEITDEIPEGIPEEIPEGIPEEIPKERTGETPKENSGTEIDWPDGKAAEYLPELESGVITYVLNETELCQIELEQITPEAYQSYLTKLVEEGFAEDYSLADTQKQKTYSRSSPEGVVNICIHNTPNYIKITVEIRKDTR